MSLIKRFFRKPRRQPIGRDYHQLTIAERLDLSLRAGRYDARLWIEW